MEDHILYKMWSYKFQVMHYGLTNAPATFQRFMNNIFKDLLDICVVCLPRRYIDLFEDQSKHDKHVHEALQCLQDNNSFAKPEKCESNIDTMNFLGCIIGPDGLCMDESKVQVIQDWPIPRKVKEIQSF